MDNLLEALQKAIEEKHLARTLEMIIPALLARNNGIIRVTRQEVFESLGETGDIEWYIHYEKEDNSEEYKWIELGYKSHHTDHPN